MIDPAQVAEAQAEIDKKIIQLQERIRALLEARNRLSAISCLPPEVLERIFIWRTAPSDKAPHISAAWSRCLKAITISHVCRRWRTVARGARQLWTHIPTNRAASIQLATYLLRLSNSMPINVEIHSNHKNEGTVQTLIPGELPRIRSLSLNVNVRPEEARGPAALVQNFCGPAPLLENLILEVRGVPLPAIMFDNAPLQLRTLEMYACDYEWQMTTRWCSTKLTRLEIDDPVHRIAHCDLLILLQRAPNLIQLSLGNVLGDVTSGETYPRIRTNVELPHLRSITSRFDFVESQIAFLSSLKTSGLVVADITADLNSSTQDVPISRVLAHIFPPLKLISTRARFLSLVSWDQFFLIRLGNKKPFYQFDEDDENPFHLLVRVMQHQTPILKDVLAAFGTLALQNVTVMYIDGRDDFDVIWIDAFRTLPAVSHLGAGNTAAVQLIVHLIHERDAGKDTSGELSFPALKRLQFVEVGTEQLGCDLREALIYGLEKRVQPHGILEEINVSIIPSENEGDEAWIQSLKDRLGSVSRGSFISGMY